MDQENTKPGPGGMKGSWRDRLGISKELPKISEEFKQTPQKPAAADRREPVSDNAGASPRPGTPVAKPAPMAPRPNAAELGDRLRKQREAAERMAEQRVAEAKERALHEQRPALPSSNERRPALPSATEQRPALPPANPGVQPGSARPRFTFADEELRQAKQDPAAPRDATPRQWSPGKVAAPNSPRPVFTADRQTHSDPRIRATAPAPAPRQPGSAMPPSYARSQPSSPQRVPSYPPPGHSPPGAQDRQWQPRSPRQAPPPPYEPYRRDASAETARQLDDPYAQEDPYRRQQRQPEQPRPRNDYRAAHSRDLDYVEEESDELFEDDQNYSGQPRRRATAQDYTQAYREYEDGYEQQEQRRRTGPLLLIVALIAVGAIAGGLIYVYQKGAVGDQASGEADVPVVAEPSEPVKTEPEPAAAAEDAVPATQQQTMAPSPQMQSSEKKQIYDRILGETTLEEQEQIVPSEEQPVSPEDPAQGFDADPLPLPLPPPPGGSTDDQSGSLEPPGQTQSTAANTKSAAENVSQQASPAAASLDNEPPAASDAALSTPPEPAESSAAPVIPKPEPKAVTAEQKIESELAFAEQPAPSKQAAAESGPIQIAQLPASDAPSAAATFTAVPQSLPDRSPGSSATAKRRPMTGRATDRVVFNANTNFNKAKSAEIAQIESAPVTTQSIAEPTTEPATEPQPVPQQQAVLQAPPPQASPSHGTGSGFLIQLASYKSEADALAGYEQLRQQHGTILGSLTPDIQKTDLGANGVFYRLQLGSFSSKQAARNACTSLLAAGERDCLVKAR